MRKDYNGEEREEYCVLYICPKCGGTRPDILFEGDTSVSMKWGCEFCGNSCNVLNTVNLEQNK